jgi:hypothetical protein
VGFSRSIAITLFERCASFFTSETGSIFLVSVQNAAIIDNINATTTGQIFRIADRAIEN